MKRLAMVGIGSTVLIAVRLWSRIVFLWGNPAAPLAAMEILSVIGLLVLGCALRFLLPYVIYGLQQIGEKGWRAWPGFEAKYVASFALAAIGYGIILVTVPGVIRYLVGTEEVAVIALAYAGQDLGQNVVKRIRERRGEW